ncbi:DUF1684 domain-containing protein [Nocardia camponoti]|uniref:DUF1684 domain-containing protein n=1 Tax=Nocardia camponoti TaxID=1616106 RepID=A0A917VDN3_9NOCA|nr:DUF1684 domain-containing protein [Nocardia camponoti]GGK66271.1 hypothetical protein GCM10011591_43000 [Nocardia camponoti]
MTATLNTTAFTEEWTRWHEEREAALRAPLGWLSLTGLHWLTDSPEHLDGVPGTWWVTDEKVFITAQPADRLVFDGELVAGVSILTPVEGAPGLLVDNDGRQLEVIRRSGQFAVRVHDSAAATLRDFTGVVAYPADPRWVVTGNFTPFETERTVTTGAVVAGLEHHHRAQGTIEFTLKGQRLSLVAFGTPAELRVLFTDATSGVTTYPAARVLTVGAVAEDGTVELDFNRAVNLPCAFTDYATCPVAPAENRLSVAVEAGEQDPRR